MILHRLGGLALSVMILFAALSPAPLIAQASDAACRAVLDSPRLPEGGSDGFSRLQRVLSIALDRDTALLDDGLRGPESDQALVDLCVAVPFPVDSDEAPETLRLIVEYARLTDLVEDPDWGVRLRDPDLIARLRDGDDPGLALRLAGSPAMKAAVMDPDAAIATCETAPLSDAQRAGLTALSIVDARVGDAPDPLTEACALYPTLRVPGGFSEALSRFGILEDVRAGAVAALLSPDFVPWLLETEAGLLRLLGSTPAVQRLVEDFLEAEPAPAPPPSAPPTPPLVIAEPASCRIAPGAVRFTRFGPDQVAQLADSRDVGPALRALAEARVTETALLADILGVLGENVDACLRDRIEAVLALPDGPAHVFRLNEAGVAGLAFVDAFSDSQPVAEALLGRFASSRAQLLDGTRAAIRRSLEDRFEAEIEAAAGLFASAAEPLPPTVDLPAVGLPVPDPIEQPETFIVTEVTDATLEASIQNAAFVDALLNEQFAPAVSREVLMGDVRRVLTPVAAAEIARLVAADARRIETLVEERWAMTPALADAILGFTALAEPFDLSEEVAQELLGLAYPNRRLMQSAFAAVEPPLPDDLQARATDLSERVFPDLDGADLMGEIAATENCGCVLRRKDHSLVYAFHPFWLSPRIPDPEDADGDASPAEGAAVAAPTLPVVDFELIERLAFYGLHWNDFEAPGVLDLQFQEQWENMRRAFVFSAQRHRTRVDLAIRITGWEDWTEAQIETVVTTTDAMMAPFHRYDDLSFEEAAQFLPTLFDKPQPDALTLIVDGYDGLGLNPDADKLVALVQRIARPLEERGQEVNLAFDMDLSDDTRDQAALGDIGGLLEPDADDRATVQNILIFLERPTAQTGPALRERLENASFSTVETIRILRHILPVVPPGGHQFVGAEGASLPLSEADEYGQFKEDIVYFQDTFGGMGFWPVPQADNPDHAAVAVEVFDRWDLWVFPAELAEFELRFDRVCAFACPNRFYLSAAAILLAVALGGLIWRSFYSGLADRIAFRMGTVWVGTAVIFVLLVLLTSCDQFARLPPIFLGLLVLSLMLIVGFGVYQRARNGPKP